MIKLDVQKKVRETNQPTKVIGTKKECEEYANLFLQSPFKWQKTGQAKMLNCIRDIARTGLTLNQAELEGIFQKHAFSDYKFIDTKDIIVAQWVRMRCMFGCQSYGKNGCCPPNVPSVDECKEFFASYQKAVVFHLTKQVEKPEDRIPWSRETNKRLLKVEREAFLLGNYKAFLLFMDECRLCSKCTGNRAECRNPTQARPSPESFAVDVFGTVRKHGYPIDVLTDYGKTMNRYAFLMIE